MRALSGIKVLDLTRLAPGTTCTMIHGRPRRRRHQKSKSPALQPRTARNRPAPRACARAERLSKLAFPPWGRNKKSLGLNLKSPAGKQIFLRCIGPATWWSNSGPASPGTESCNKLPLSPIIHCGVTSYGSTDPTGLWSGMTSIISPCGRSRPGARAAPVRTADRPTTRAAGCMARSA